MSHSRRPDGGSLFNDLNFDKGDEKSGGRILRYPIA